MKFVSKENFLYVWNYLIGLLTNKIDNPENGTDGQVLTKVGTSAEWKTLDVSIEELSDEDLKEIFETE